MPIKIGSVLSTADVAHIAGGLGVAARAGIDGPGASGKSTLAAGLAAALPDAVLVEGDDFYRPKSDSKRSEVEVGGLFDLPRLASQVLFPHAEGRDFRYQRYDWEAETLGEWATGVSAAPLIVEGIYSTHEMVRDFYDLRIWVTAPRAIRLALGMERDGEGARSRWVDIWMPAEDRYISEQAPQDHAHLVLDGSGTIVDQTGEAIFTVARESLP